MQWKSYGNCIGREWDRTDKDDIKERRKRSKTRSMTLVFARANGSDDTSIRFDTIHENGRRDRWPSGRNFHGIHGALQSDRVVNAGIIIVMDLSREYM